MHVRVNSVSELKQGLKVSISVEVDQSDYTIQNFVYKILSFFLYLFHFIYIDWEHMFRLFHYSRARLWNLSQFEKFKELFLLWNAIWLLFSLC